MFAFEEWHSAMEMRRYIARFIHHIGGLPDLSALKFTRYNQYESLVMPLVRALGSKGVRFEYGVQVKNVIVSKAGGKKTATKIVYEKGGREGEINLTENDLVFVTNGSITENCYLWRPKYRSGARCFAGRKLEPLDEYCRTATRRSASRRSSAATSRNRISCRPR